MLGLPPLSLAVPAPGGFDPLAVADLLHAEINMTGADLLLSGSDAVDWGDTTGGRVKLTEATNRFTYAAADAVDATRPSLVSDGVADKMDAASNLTLDTSWDVFIVARQDIVANEYVWSWGNGGTIQASLFARVGPTSWIQNTTGARSGKDHPTTNWMGTAWHCVRLHCSGTHASVELWVDGVLISTTTYSTWTGNPDFSGESHPFTLGNYFGASFFDGAFRAVSIGTNVATADAVAMDAYLTAAWVTV